MSGIKVVLLLSGLLFAALVCAQSDNGRGDSDEGSDTDGGDSDGGSDMGDGGDRDPGDSDRDTDSNNGDGDTGDGSDRGDSDNDGDSNMNNGRPRDARNDDFDEDDDRIRNCTGQLIDLTSDVINGSDLMYCQFPGRQCCDNEYLLKLRAKLRRRILQSLQDELEENGDRLEQLVVGVLEFLENIFIPRFFYSLFPPFNKTESLAKQYATEFQSNLIINDESRDFNTIDFMEEIVNDIVAGIIRYILELRVEALTEEQRICVERILIDSTAEANIARNLEQLRRAVTTLTIIQDFYLSLEHNITTAIGYTLTDTCLEVFINLRCLGCRQELERTCRNTCGAIIRGCFAGFITRLTSQLDILWNVVNQLLAIIRSIVRALVRNSGRLIRIDFDNRNVFRNLVARLEVCSLDIDDRSNGDDNRDSSDDDNSDIDDDDSNGDSDGDVDDDIPNELIERSSSLLNRGAFEYSNEGPRFCRSFVNRNCWNGETVVDEDTTNFTGVTIEEQRNNPLFDDAAIDELEEQVNQLGTPISDFLLSELLQSISPENLTITGALEPTTDSTTDSTTDGANMGVGSMAAILISTALAFVFMK